MSQFHTSFMDSSDFSRWTHHKIKGCRIWVIYITIIDLLPYSYVFLRKKYSLWKTFIYLVILIGYLLGWNDQIISKGRFYVQLTYPLHYWRSPWERTARGCFFSVCQNVSKAHLGRQSLMIMPTRAKKLSESERPPWTAYKQRKSVDQAQAVSIGSINYDDDEKSLPGVWTSPGGFRWPHGLRYCSRFVRKPHGSYPSHMRHSRTRPQGDAQGHALSEQENFIHLKNIEEYWKIRRPGSGDGASRTWRA